MASGILTIILTVFAMALTDAFVKYASSDMTLWQIYVCRSVLALPVLVLLAKGSVRPMSLGWVSLRSLMLVAMYLAIYAAIPVLDLSVIAATLYTGPLFIVLLSAFFLKLRITALHWCAVGLGFVGVLFVVQPRGADFTSLSLIPLIAAALYASAAVLTRAKCAEEAPSTLAINLNLALVICGALASLGLWLTPDLDASVYPFLLGNWSPFDAETVGVLVIMAVLIIGVTLGLARAYQSPHPQVIATFDYAYLIFAAFWGFVFFGEIPDVYTVAGICLIAAAGFVVLKADTGQEGSS
jgi:drug/metabolite transporter (DMT)-like permease